MTKPPRRPPPWLPPTGGGPRPDVDWEGLSDPSWDGSRRNAAWAALVAGYSGLLRQALAKDANFDDDLLDDVLQETWESLTRRARQLPDARNPGGYIFRVARSALMGEHRRRARARKREEQHLALEVADAAAAGAPRSPDADDRAWAEAVTLADWVAALVAALPAPDRLLWHYRMVEGLSFADLAPKLHMREGAAMTRFSRLRDKLRQAGGAP